jgi:hypothetical protein
VVVDREGLDLHRLGQAAKPLGAGVCVDRTQNAGSQLANGDHRDHEPLRRVAAERPVVLDGDEDGGVA